MHISIVILIALNIRIHLVLLGFLLNDGNESLFIGFEIDGKEDSYFFGYLLMVIIIIHVLNFFIITLILEEAHPLTNSSSEEEEDPF